MKGKEVQRNEQDVMPEREDCGRYTRCLSAGFPVSPWGRCLFAVMGDVGGRRTLNTEVGFGGGGCTNQELSLK